MNISLKKIAMIFINASTFFSATVLPSKDKEAYFLRTKTIKIEGIDRKVAREKIKIRQRKNAALSKNPALKNNTPQISKPQGITKTKHSQKQQQKPNMIVLEKVIIDGKSYTRIVENKALTKK